MPPEPKAIARIYGRQVRAEYDATMRDLAASERHEPDTVAERWYLTPHKDAAAQCIYSTRPGPVISGQDVTGDHVGYVYRREDGERIVAAVNGEEQLAEARHARDMANAAAGALAEQRDAARRERDALLDRIYAEAGEHHEECPCWMCKELRRAATAPDPS